MFPSRLRMPPANLKPKRALVWFLSFVVALTALVGWTVWYEFLREVPQQFATDDEAFKYGSIGTEDSAGIPYWIWVVLPRVFPEYLPGPGGYSSLGVAW